VEQPDYNADVLKRNAGRPLAASEAQVEEVLKLRSLRGIAEDTSLGLPIVRTIIDKGDSRDRTSIKHLQRIRSRPQTGDVMGGRGSAGAAAHPRRLPQAHQRHAGEGA
jgi:hypothetical protein